MIIISWDIGIRNLAYCILYVDNKNSIITPNDIISWDLHCFESEQKVSISLNREIIIFIKNWKNTWNYILNNEQVTVLIERQPNKNLTLQMIIIALTSWFVDNYPDSNVLLVSPTKKENIQKGSYKDRKQSAVNNVY